MENFHNWSNLIIQVNNTHTSMIIDYLSHNNYEEQNFQIIVFNI